jgi:hypothetical protein
MKLSLSLSRRWPALVAVSSVGLLSLSAYIASDSWLTAGGAFAFWGITLLILARIDLEESAGRILVLFLSFAVSVFGAFVITLCMFTPLLILAHSPLWWVLTVHAATTFFAVFLPSYWLPPASRWIAAGSLLAGGIVLYCFNLLGHDVSCGVGWDPKDETFYAGWWHLAVVFVAGLGAVALHWLPRRRNIAPETTAAEPIN